MSEMLGREVIYFEQRGIAPSLPGTLCPALDTGDDARAAFAGCRADLESRGVDVHSFNTLENAADIAAIPAALGVAQIDLIAGSYATRLASRVLARHPESIRAAVLGGVDVPGAPARDSSSEAFGLLLASAGGYFGTECAADVECAAFLPGFDFPTVVGQLGATIARDGAVNIVGRPFPSIEAIRDALFPMMYVAQIRNMFFAALYHAANESDALFFAHIGEGDAAVGEAFVGRLLMSAQQAVFGGESVMSFVTRCYDGSAAHCSVVGDRIDDYPSAAFTEPTGSDHPVLMVSGALDPATPIADIDAYLPLYPNGRRSTFACLGHDISRISNLSNGTCVVEQVRAFLDDPSAPLVECAEALCDALPLIPARPELLLVVNEYVEMFEE